MRAYDPGDESSVRTSKLVREWSRSGLIEQAQANVLEVDLRTELRRTNLVLRIVLFGFAMSVLQSILGLFALMIDLNNDWAIGIAAIVAGVATVILTEGLIARLQFYRFGVEEACAVCAAGLIAGGIGLLLTIDAHPFPTMAIVLVVSAVSLALYVRYGYLYAVLISMIAVAAVPFLGDLPVSTARSVSSLILFFIFALARWLRSTSDEELRVDEYGAIEAAAWLGVYAVLIDPDFAFSWTTYGAIWILPIVGLALGIHGRHRGMIWVNIVTALVTLSTNKMYLGWPRHTWDPILLGLLLAGTAIVVRRWLSAGPDGERDGLTARRILASDKESLSLVSTVAGAAQPGPTQPSSASGSPPDTYQPGGGSSGGAGAGGRF